MGKPRSALLGALVLSAVRVFADAPAVPPPSPSIWAKKGAYPARPGNDVQMLVDGQASYSEIAAAMKKAKRFLYVTVSYGDMDFLPVPESGETIFDLYRARAKDRVDVKLVIWQPTLKIADTIPDQRIAGVNDGPGAVQARWDKAPGYFGWYHGVHGTWWPIPLWFPASVGCNHQKTYVMDDGQGGVVAFVGGINPVQAYWDTPSHDALDGRRVARGTEEVKGLNAVPPLHDIFYKIVGPSAGDVIANFVERYNGASEPHKEETSDAKAPVAAEEIAEVEGGVSAQILRTIAPHKYKTSKKGDTGIKEMYLNALNAAARGSIIYIENQYFFDHVIIDAIREAAERGAKIICLLTSKPDEGTPQGYVEQLMEWIAKGESKLPGVVGHQNVAVLTLGNSRPDPDDPAKTMASETYIHSKNLFVLNDSWAAATGGSANIAFTSMLFHAEMNVAVDDPAKAREWVVRLWSEHLGISTEKARELARDPDAALAFFKSRAAEDVEALDKGLAPPSRVYPWGTKFPDRHIDGGDLKQGPGVVGQAPFDLPGLGLADVKKSGPQAATEAGAPARPSAETPATLINLGEKKTGDVRCGAPNSKCLDFPFDAAYARKEDKENLAKAFQATIQERAAGRLVYFDAGLQDERASALAAAFQIHQLGCGDPNVDKDKLWESVQETLQQGGFDGKYKALREDIKGWIFHPEQNKWVCGEPPRA